MEVPHEIYIYTEEAEDTIQGEILYDLDDDFIYQVEFAPDSWESDRPLTDTDKAFAKMFFDHLYINNDGFRITILEKIREHERDKDAADRERQAISRYEDEQDDRMLAVGGAR
jgi:hypothetical protein